MKKLICIILVAACTAVAAQAQTKTSEVAKFKTDNVAIGKAKQGVPATATFTFTNTGKTPLVIERVAPSCGCTAADYTKTAIAPGSTGVVKATYNAAAVGVFNKSISVKFSGVDDMTTLSFSGEVEAVASASAVAVGH